MPPENTQVPINMRVHPDKVRLIDIAADLEGVNRTQFITGAATKRAEEVLLHGPDEQGPGLIEVNPRRPHEHQ